MLGALDRWAAAHPGLPVFAQTGLSRGTYAHMTCSRFLPQDAFLCHVGAARVLVAHAGMGTILTAAELGKPLVVMPRRAGLGEHRNDHQLATVAEMRHLPNLVVAEEEDALAAALDLALKTDAAAHPGAITARASDELIAAVAGFVNGRNGA
jgi:UDP-N-acetylglucosamine transferase subunit ALG13